MKENVIIIGLTGENSAGKGVVGQFLKEYYSAVKVLYENTREKILTIAKEAGVDLVDRPALSKFSDEYTERYGGDVYCSSFYVKAALHKFDILIIDSVRRVDEARFILNKKGLLVSVTAPAEHRFEWAKNRGSLTDNIKTLQDFIDLDYKEASPESWSLNLAETMKLANICLVNDESKDFFMNKLREALVPFVDAKLKEAMTVSTGGVIAPGHGNC